jgi:hypothetical protein
MGFCLMDPSEWDSLFAKDLVDFVVRACVDWETVCSSFWDSLVSNAPIIRYL